MTKDDDRPYDSQPLGSPANPWNPARHIAANSKFNHRREGREEYSDPDPSVHEVVQEPEAFFEILRKKEAVGKELVEFFNDKSEDFHTLAQQIQEATGITKTEMHQQRRGLDIVRRFREESPNRTQALQGTLYPYENTQKSIVHLLTALSSDGPVVLLQGGKHYFTLLDQLPEMLIESAETLKKDSKYLKKSNGDFQGVPQCINTANDMEIMGLKMRDIRAKALGQEPSIFDHIARGTITDRSR